MHNFSHSSESVLPARSIAVARSQRKSLSLQRAISRVTCDESRVLLFVSTKRHKKFLHCKVNNTKRKMKRNYSTYSVYSSIRTYRISVKKKSKKIKWVWKNERIKNNTCDKNIHQNVLTERGSSRICYFFLGQFVYPKATYNLDYDLHTDTFSRILMYCILRKYQFFVMHLSVGPKKYPTLAAFTWIRIDHGKIRDFYSNTVCVVQTRKINA